jgi:hypothetical protein
MNFYVMCCIIILTIMAGIIGGKILAIFYL